jgi:hypothetical protein
MQQVFLRASEPLVMLKACCRHSADTTDGPGSTIAEQSLALSSQASIAHPGNIRARWLVTPGIDMLKGSHESDITRQQHVLDWLIDQCTGSLKEAIQTLPEKVPLTVQISAATESTVEDVIRKAWKRAWDAHELRPAAVLVDVKPMSLMELDAWLDSADGAARQGARLLVHIQLHKVLSDNPPANSAEVAVALLIVNGKTAADHALIGQALLHRPVHATSTSLAGDLSLALRWGRSLPAAIQHLWHTGFDAISSASLFRSVRDAGVVTRTDPTGQHDIDQAIGHGGAAAGWLALACAAEHASNTTQPQLVAQSQGDDLWLAIVSPLQRPAPSDMDTPT